MQDQVADDPEMALRAMLPKARATAAHAGRKHPLWDVIFDAESLLAGTRTVIRYPSRAEGIARLRDLLQDYAGGGNCSVPARRGD